MDSYWRVRSLHSGPDLMATCQAVKQWDDTAALRAPLFCTWNLDFPLCLQVISASYSGVLSLRVPRLLVFPSRNVQEHTRNLWVELAELPDRLSFWHHQRLTGLNHHKWPLWLIFLFHSSRNEHVFLSRTLTQLSVQCENFPIYDSRGTMGWGAWRLRTVVLCV